MYDNLKFLYWIKIIIMMTSSNGNIFRVTGLLCGKFTGHWWILHTQSPVTRSFGVFFNLCLNKRLSKQSWGWWFETPSRSLWRHCSDFCRTQLTVCVLLVMEINSLSLVKPGELRRYYFPTNVFDHLETCCLIGKIVCETITRYITKKTV